MKTQKPSSAETDVVAARLFDFIIVPRDPDPGRDLILRELGAMHKNPSSALRFAAQACIRQCQLPTVEADFRKLTQAYYSAIAEGERTANDLAYLAALSGNKELSLEAFEALDKSRIALDESAEPSVEDALTLYSSCILLTQAWPTTENLDIISNIALLRASLLTGYVFNSFEVLLNLSIELHSDDGAIDRPKFYEALFNTFRGIEIDQPWLEPNPNEPLTAKDFAGLVRSTVRGGDVSAVSAIAASQPRQQVLDLV